MKARHTLTQVLRWSSAAVLVAGLLVWAATGARVGWTQTTRTAFHQDEITGIEYPVQTPAFVGGVEIPVLSAIAASVLLAMSFVPQLRNRSTR